MIMQGLLRRSYPLLLRRLVTLIPALAILAIGIDPSRALVVSQVVLSFGIPFALIPLIRLTERMGPRDIMKEMDLALVEYMPDAKAEELVAARTARR